MAHTVRIKRRSATNAAPNSLANAELAFNEVTETLYYGKGTGGSGGTASSIVPIGGIGAFVGLTGNQSIAGVKTFSSDGYFNSIRIGAGPGGTNNLVIGNNAGASLTAGTAPNGNENTAIGNFALDANTTGYYNTAVGYNALSAITTNFRCTAVGWNALANNTGDRNTAVGSNALGANTTGTFNVAVGNNALASNTTGGNNMAVGNAALNSSTTAGNNTAIGTGALFGLTTTPANNNIGIGDNAGRYLSDGTTAATQMSSCVYIGASIRANANDETNAIVIGANQTSSGSNTTKIGTAATTSTIIPGGSLTVSSGSVTATSFIGNLNNTLTLATSGTGLSGSTTFNNSTGATFTVTSNATNANTASTIVARDASGNFSAGTITAALSGNASTATTLATGRTIGMTGDVTWTSASFNGSGNVTGTATLATVATAGTYRSVTVNAKGLVTSGTNPTTLSDYGITDALSNATNSTQNGYFGDIYLYDDNTPSHYLQITNSANLTAARVFSLNVNDANRTVSLSGDLTVSSAATISGTNTGDQTITLTGDVTGSGTGSFGTTLANTAVTAGSYTAATVTVDSKGRITAASSNTIPAAANNGTLTLAVSGTGLSGSASFTANQSTNATFTVTSNATNANTASTIVARDASGNFSAGTVTLGGLSSSSATFNAFNAVNGNQSVYLMDGQDQVSNSHAKALYVGSNNAGSSTLYLNSRVTSSVVCNVSAVANATTSYGAGIISAGSYFNTNAISIFNSGTTIVNAFGAATAITLGATTGTTTIRNDLSVSKSITATEGFRVSSSAINAQTAAYTLATTDNGKVVTINSASAVNVTIGTAVGSAGFSCTVIQLGAGQVTFAASSTTLNSANGLKIAAQHGAATIFCYATNTFNIAGNMTT